jgi:hypothetical protein
VSDPLLAEPLRAAMVSETPFLGRVALLMVSMVLSRLEKRVSPSTESSGRDRDGVILHARKAAQSNGFPVALISFLSTHAIPESTAQPGTHLWGSHDALSLRAQSSVQQSHRSGNNMAATVLRGGPDARQEGGIRTPVLISTSEHNIGRERCKLIGQVRCMGGKTDTQKGVRRR